MLAWPKPGLQSLDKELDVRNNGRLSDQSASPAIHGGAPLSQNFDQLKRQTSKLAVPAASRSSHLVTGLQI